jgi:Ca-activated chloride channel family protein
MSNIAFGAPAYLWLLTLPAALTVVWIVRLIQRRTSLRRWARRRTVPVRERFSLTGDLAFWFCQILALTLMVAAVARPLAPSSLPQRTGIDIVVLQDASASMRVDDVARVATETGVGMRPSADRWQRSMQFLRTLGDTLSWHSDRLALAVFAHIAAPQIRLTRDPNTLFFFIDHLYDRPPFRLEDDTTWDTNLEIGIAWGLRIVEKDEEVHGRSPNARLFVVLSDGESWSGEVAKSVASVVERGIPIFVVGVGSLGGGPLPAVKTSPEDPSGSPGVSRLERAALQRIAAARRRQYFELDRDPDRAVANTIVSAGRRLSRPIGLQQTADELYWWLLWWAAASAATGMIFLRRRIELVLVFGAGLIAAGSIGPILF